MSLLCPECRLQLDERSLVCPSGHRFENHGEVLSLLSADFADRFGGFRDAVADYRDRLGKRIVDEAVYERLPHGEAQKGSFEWRLRVWDLDLVRRLLRRRGVCRVLDVGSYNGWLSRHLSDDGHDVTAIDYFRDPHDGLGARRFYRRAKWRSLQINLLDLSILDETYDSVILNRCLQFFPDPAAYFDHAKQRVAPGGVLIATGLELHRDPGRKEAHFRRLDREFRQRYGMGFFLHPTRGVLDRGHFRALSERGMKLSWMPQLRARNLLSLVLKSRPRFLLGVWAGDS